VYAVEALRPESAKDAEAEVPTCTVGVHEDPKHRKILYPANPEPPLSVEAVQERDALDVLVDVTARLCGIVGAVASTVTVTVAVVEPFELVAVSV
jgi:hypothetical protein